MPPSTPSGGQASLLDLAEACVFEWRVDPDGTSRLVSLAGPFERLTGHPAAGNLRELWPALVHPEDRQILRAFEQQLRANATAICRLRFVRDDGAPSWWRVKARPVWSHRDQRVIAVQGVATLLDPEDATAGTARGSGPSASTEADLRRYELLAEHSRDIILFMTFEDGRILEANAAAEAAYGYRREELLARTIRDLRAPDTNDLTSQQMVEAGLQGILFETTHRRKDGSTFPVEVSSRGATIGGRSTLVSVVRDVTARRLRQQALRESEELLQEALRVSRSFAFEWDPVTDRVRRSSSCAPLLGVQGDLETEDTGQGYFGRVHPDDRERFAGRMAGLAPGVEAYEAKYRVLRPDGATTVLEESGRAFFGPDGAIEKVVGVATDVTAREEAEGALRASEHRFRSVVESNMIGVVFADALTGRVTDANDEYLRIIGRTRDDLLAGAINWVAITPPESVERELRSTAFARPGGRVLPYEKEYVRPDGTRVPVIIGGAYLDGGIREVVAFVLDNTERKQAEEALRLSEHRMRQANEQLREADRRKDEFLSVLSHEMRTPLNAVVGWSHLLARGGLEPALQERAIDAIARNAVAQAQIVDDVLDVSRIITGQLRIAFGPVDVALVLNQAIESVRPSAAAKSIDLSLDLEPGIVVSGDANRLRQVFWNLLSNAVKFTPPRGRVAVGLALDAGDVSVTVSDTGIGIAPDFLPRVFDRFTQADSSITRRSSGVGLGLAIVRHLLELHGGTVEVSSAGDALGATFRVRLPVCGVQDGGFSRAGAVHVDLPPGQGRLQGLLVLAVDDDADSREMVKAALESEGALVTAARSADEAVRAFDDARDFDLLIADIAMPDEDGYSLLRRLRTVSTVPAIAVTALGRTEDRNAAIEAGFAEHLKKPLLPEELVMMVARHARRRTR